MTTTTTVADELQRVLAASSIIPALKVHVAHIIRTCAHSSQAQLRTRLVSELRGERGARSTISSSPAAQNTMVTRIANSYEIV